MKPQTPSASASPDRSFTQGLPSHELSVLLQVSSTLAASLDLEKVLQGAIESAVEVLSLETGAIYMIDGTRLHLGATTPPLPEHFPDELRLADLADHPHIRESVRAARPIYIEDTSTAELSPAEKAVVDVRQLRSILYIPLFLEDRPTGVLIVGSTGEVRTFTEHELGLARTLSFQIALAVANAHLFQSVRSANQELKRAYDATLEGWSLALEMRDQETQGHTLRVAEMALRLARQMQVPENDIEHIVRGALLHDIGKMSIPDAILRKPGPLSDEEWAIMKTHPELAYRLLQRIDYLLPALDIPYNHHEKWDGSGYPRGLRGTQIPLPARIFAVVDVYDALTSDRPYRKAWPVQEALEYLRKHAGTHFDPEIVKVFLETRDQESENSLKS